MDSLTTGQIAEWEAFDRMSPIGGLKDDVRFAYLLSTLTNLFISAYGKKGAKMSELKDFLIDWDNENPEDAKKQSVDDIKKILMGMVTGSK